MHHLGIRRKLMRYVELQVKIEITKAFRSRYFPVCKYHKEESHQTIKPQVVLRAFALVYMHTLAFSDMRNGLIPLQIFHSPCGMYRNTKASVSLSVYQNRCQFTKLYFRRFVKQWEKTIQAAGARFFGLSQTALAYVVVDKRLLAVVLRDQPK